MNCPVCGSKTAVLRTDRAVGLVAGIGIRPYVVRQRRCSNATCGWIGLTEEAVKKKEPAVGLS
jgi:hypothetical protein